MKTQEPPPIVACSYWDTCKMALSPALGWIRFIVVPAEIMKKANVTHSVCPECSRALLRAKDREVAA